MEIDKFYENIGEIILEQWGDSRNKLSLCCLYSLNIFGKNDLVYWKTIIVINNILNNKVSDSNVSLSEKDLLKFITAIYCILASNQCIYNLPAMLNVRWMDGKITPHILFGESLANLSSITILAESYKLLMNINCKTNNSNILKLFNKEIETFRNNSKLIVNFGNTTTNMIKEDFNCFKLTLLVNTINSLFLLYNYDIDFLTEKREIIFKLSKFIIDVNDIDANEIIRIINNSNFVDIL